MKFCKLTEAFKVPTFNKLYDKFFSEFDEIQVDDFVMSTEDELLPTEIKQLILAKIKDKIKPNELVNRGGGLPQIVTTVSYRDKADNFIKTPIIIFLEVIVTEDLVKVRFSSIKAGNETIVYERPGIIRGSDLNKALNKLKPRIANAYLNKM